MYGWATCRTYLVSTKDKKVSSQVGGQDYQAGFFNPNQPFAGGELATFTFSRVFETASRLSFLDFMTISHWSSFLCKKEYINQKFYPEFQFSTSKTIETVIPTGSCA